METPLWFVGSLGLLLVGSSRGETCVAPDNEVTTLNFETAELAHSNLGGQGGPSGESLLFPGESLSSSALRALVFQNVGTIEGSGSFDLKVSNESEYVPNAASGNRISGEFGVVHRSLHTQLAAPLAAVPPPPHQSLIHLRCNPVLG